MTGGSGGAIAVCLVSRNEATIDELRAYLEGAGVVCRAATGFEHGSTRRAAVVIFPDDYAEVDMVAVVDRIRRHHPVVVVVTREPLRYRPLIDPAPGEGVAVVLPRPSFGWEILDVLRAHMAPQA